MSRILILFFTLFLPSMYLAQSRTVQKNNMQWIQYYTTTHLNDDWNLQIDGGYRLQNNFEDKVGYIFRSGIAYQKTNKLSFAAGMGYLGSYKNDIFNILSLQNIIFFTYYQVKVE